MFHKLDDPLVIEVRLTISLLCLSLLLLVFICEHFWNPSDRNVSVSELNCDTLVKGRSRNIWDYFVKLINSESPAFTNVNMSLVFQILGDDRRASRSRFNVHTCPSPYTSRGWRWIWAGRMFFSFKIESLNASLDRRD
jgi:hypothetical protein